MNKQAKPPSVRGRYQGVLQIFRYNWPYYALAAPAGLLGLGVVALAPIPTVPKALIALGSSCVIAGAAVSLVVSHYIYDLSPLCQWRWIAETLPERPKHWVNIHAGLDETSGALSRLFPEAHATVWEIYDPAAMTESSIARARRLTSCDGPAAHADFRRLPLQDCACDTIFVIFTAHELRSAQARLRFFKELRRVLKPQGHLLLVEHLRDWKNLLAFGPGFLHFYPRREWVLLANEAEFAIAKEFNMTPFVKVFLLVRPAESA